MTKPSINLQDLRRRIYTKAKAEKSCRFWGMYVHVCKMETLQEAYRLTKRNNGSPGIDGVTFEAIEAGGVEKYLQEIHTELTSKTYYPMRNRKQAIPKGNGKRRILSIPAIRERIVQSAIKLILEPIFESDFQPGSYGYRPKRTAHAALERVAKGVIQGKTRVIDVDLTSYLDTVRHDIMLRQLASRVNDKELLRLVKLILKTNGKKGIPQGSPLSPLLSNNYLNETDKMLEKAKAVTKEKGYTHLEYARWADDLVILIDGHRQWDWLVRGVYKRLAEELGKLGLTLNEEKTRQIDLCQEASFTFLGFELRRSRTRKGKWGILKTPKASARAKLVERIKELLRRYRSQPLTRVIEKINPILRGWVNYFRVGNSSRCFTYVKDWIEKKERHHLMQARKLKGFGWRRWSRAWLYQSQGLYSDYKIRYYQGPKVTPSR